MQKFSNSQITADGKTRAFVKLDKLETLWFNTGTLCNIKCANCYIKSSPTNDALSYLSLKDVRQFLDEIKAENYPVAQIGWTGGEPFLNPEMCEMLKISLEAGFENLILTNAMTPLMRSKIKASLLDIKKRFGTQKIIMRVSLDHHTAKLHNTEREAGAFEKALEGLEWLSGEGFRIHIAGRSWTDESDEEINKAYNQVFEDHQIKLDQIDDTPMVFFPEMDEEADIAEITTECWDILGVKPKDIMCSSSRMIVKHRGAQKLSVVACTLLPYESKFNLGSTLKEAAKQVRLNHPHCSRFCVLGGASCSA